MISIPSVINKGGFVSHHLKKNKVLKKNKENVSNVIIIDRRNEIFDAENRFKQKEN